MKNTRDDIINIIKKLNPDFIKEQNNLMLEIEILIDKILIYTNLKEIPETLNKIIAKSYIEYINKEKILKEHETGEVISLSDNGQSVTFKSKRDSIFILAEDETFFNSLIPFLDRYVIKKVRVVGEELLNENTK